jgi:hypothetical protein
MNLDESLRDRAIANGPFEDTSALAQAVKMVFRRGRNWDPLPPESKEALEIIASQVAMILTGDAAEDSHWNAVATYARMRALMLEPRSTPTPIGLESFEDKIRSLASIRTQPRGMRPAEPADEA